MIALRKKMRAKLTATTQAMPQPLMARGACSREEPQPKLAPATRMSPGPTFPANSGSSPARQWRPNSSWEVVTRYRAGMMRSVSMLSPTFQALPS